MPGRCCKEYELCNSGIMKTSLDIPDKELKDLIRFSKAATKRAAILTAIAEYNRRKRMAELIQYSGKSDTFMTHEELMKTRRMD